MKTAFLVFACLLVFSVAAHAATIHGAAYDASLSLVKNVHFEINTTPKQHHVSKNGLYFFFAPVGTYKITAEKFYQKELIYNAESIVTVEKDGEFNIDIVMQKISETEIPEEEEPGPSLLTLIQVQYGRYILVGSVIGLVLAGAVLYFFFRKKARKEKKEPSEKKEEKEPIKEVKKEEPVRDVDASAERVLAVIKEEGGRTTQKDIRKQIPLSEAKISLMISELEDQGKVQKIKKGRGNIIILK